MSTYSTNLKIELIGTGEQAGTWGVTTDNNFSNVFEQSIVGRVAVPFTDADVTLTASNNVNSQSFRNVYLNCTGTNTASRNLIVPTINKNYVVQNNTTGGFNIVIKTSAGTGITVPNGKTVAVYADGTNVIQAFDYFPSASTGALTVTSLTDSGLTSGRVTYAGTSGLLTDSANFTYDGSLLSVLSGSIRLSNGTGIQWGNVNNYIAGDGSSNAVLIATNSLERLRIDSAGAVGIGTATPSSFGRLAVQSSVGQDAANFTDGTNYTLKIASGGSAVAFVGGATGSSLALGANALEKVRILSTGNVGIGTTNPASLLDVNGAISVGGYKIASNVTTSNYIWAGSSGLNFIDSTGNTVQMFIDSSGNVGVATGSPGTFGKFAVSGAIATCGSSGSLGVFRRDTNAYAGALYSASGGLLFDIASVGTALVISGTGNVGIGITPTQKLDIDGSIKLNGTNNSRGLYWSMYGGTNSAYIDVDGNTDGQILRFGTANQERMRITASGNSGAVLFGTTSAFSSNAYAQFVQSTTAWWPVALRSASRGIALSVTTNDCYALYMETNTNTLAGYISCSGSSTSYVTTSDYRLKENVKPMVGALGKVLNLKPVTYTWKADGKESQGFIAHELQEIVPECVVGEKDAMRMERYEVSPAIPATFDKENNELTPAVEAVMGEREVPAYQGVDTSFLVATLTSAIQEQQVMINELKAKVAALEAA